MKTTEKQNPNWKQLIPFYGIHRAIVDDRNGKPSFHDKENHPLGYYGYRAYQGGMCIGGTLIAIMKGLEILLK